MCMPFVPPKSRSPLHMAEASAKQALMKMRTALHDMDLADTKMIDKPWTSPGIDLPGMETYVTEATKALLDVVQAYYAIREGVRLWRIEDDKEGANEYSI